MKTTKNWRRKLSDFVDNPKNRFLILLGPIHVVLFLVLLFPFLLMIFLSLSGWEPGKIPWWLAQFNYGVGFLKVFGDARFIWSLARTFLIVAPAVGLEFVFGLIGALLFSKAFRGKKLIATLFLMPMFFMPVVVGYNFWMIFQPRGPLNYILSLMLGRAVEIPWLTERSAAMTAIILSDVWQWTPFMFLIMTAGVLSLPENPIMAAKVLGASNWQTFMYVKLPMLKNIIVIALIIRFMEALKLFDLPFIMTGGGPGFHTETLSIYAFVVAMVSGRLGYGSSLALILLILFLLIITPAIRPILRRR